jgi:hypothetical protein
MSSRNLRTLGLTAALATAALVALLGVPREGRADDRDLLVSGRIKPYLFIILDSSGSMNLKIGGDDLPAVGYGDDPDSRIYAAKEALFKVFSDRDDVHFGFATFDQDRLRAVGSHWLYPMTAAARAQLDAGGWPLAGWPLPDPEDHPLVTLGMDCDGDGFDDGTSTRCFSGDALVFGPTFSNFMPDDTDGTCLEPLDLTTERDRLNAFARLGADGGEMTQIWISKPAGGGSPAGIYRLTFQAGSGGGAVGDLATPLSVTFIAEQWDEVSPCATPVFSPAIVVADVMLSMDPMLNRFLMTDNPGPDPDAPEGTPGHWLVADVGSGATCSNSKPFTGLGWEGNYDSGAQIVGNAAFNDEATNEDPFCLAPFQDGVPAGVLPDATDPDSCVELRPLRPTELSPLGRYADRGDMIPFDWDNSNKTEFLRRLSPNFPFGPPDFGVTAHLTDTFSKGVDGLGADIGLAPALAGRPPIIAAGVTPLGKAMLDFRCWYTGKETPDGRAVPKCDSMDETAFFEESCWAGAACDLDPEFGCRRPFLILISDGIDTCAGESPVADISDLKNKTGLRTWALNLGPEKNCQAGGAGNVLHSVTTAGSGECINVSNKEGLLETLESIALTIASSAQAFAAAAVPTVQSNANQRIFLSSFRAVPEASTWDGHLSGFWKPLPIDNGTPDTGDTDCAADDAGDDTPTPGDGCHLWDAGLVLANQQFDPADPLDPVNEDKRRVFYSRQTTSGLWPTARRLLDPTNGEGGVPMDALRYDLWRAFDLIPSTTPNDGLADANEAALEIAANAVIADTLDLKSGVLSDGTLISYLLGDIFHSRPALVETPPNTRFFAENAGDNVAGDCVENESAANFNRGYRCFLARHQRRRRVLLVGANDGMLHAFDAGTFASGRGLDNGLLCDPLALAPDNSPCGTGKEVWAYMPRQVMPSVRERTLIAGHKFSVDGTPSVGDVFIDPLHNGTPTSADRLWRTVAITGLREGGSGYFALDITQPEPLADFDVDPTNGLDFVPNLDPLVPSVAECSKIPTPAGCGPVPYPSALWEFSDTTADSLIGVPPVFPVAMDEDANGAPDLGDTWSIVDIGRIRICDGAECNPEVIPNNVVDRHVAIFSGGMDQLNKAYDPRVDFDPGIQGNWLYIVDIETGKAIYKRRLDSAAPSSPAAVDTNQDGYINRIYAATLGGSLYRVDLDQDSNGNLPEVTTVDGLRDLSGAMYDGVGRIATDSNGDPVWEPVKIFDANFKDVGGSAVPTTETRPIYHPPSVFFVTEIGLYGIAFGTGDREDLWGRSAEGDEGGLQQGRFYLFVDDTEYIDPVDLPLTEDNFQLIDLAAFDPDTPNLLVSRPLGQKGWYLALEEQERVSAQAFNLLGVTFFSSFVADVATSSGETTCDNADIRAENTCSKSGFSKVFVTSTVNARPFVSDPDTMDPFFKIAGAFVSEPFTEIGYSSDGPADDGGGGGPGGGGPGGGGGPNPGDLTDEERAVMEALRDLFPENCRFTNQRIDVRLVTSDTQVRRIAAVPVCVIEKNWKEF